jgi:hypothetical protein
MKLTDTQLVLLSAASQSQDGAIELCPKLKGGASTQVIAKLLSEGLVKEIPAQGPVPVWRCDDDKGALALHITERGLAVIGVEQDGKASVAAALDQGTESKSGPSPRRAAAARKQTEAAQRKPAKAGPCRIQAGGGDRHAARPAGCDHRGLGRQTDFSREPKLTEAVAKKVYYGPVYFHRESEPYMTLAVAGTRWGRARSRLAPPNHTNNRGLSLLRSRSRRVRSQPVPDFRVSHQGCTPLINCATHTNYVG